MWKYCDILYKGLSVPSDSGKWGFSGWLRWYESTSTATKGFLSIVYFHKEASNGCVKVISGADQELDRLEQRQAKVGTLVASSVVKSTDCPSREPGFDSQHTRGGSQLPVSPVPGYLTPLLVFMGTRHTRGTQFSDHCFGFWTTQYVSYSYRNRPVSF